MRISGKNTNEMNVIDSNGYKYILRIDKTDEKK